MGKYDLTEFQSEKWLNTIELHLKWFRKGQVSEYDLTEQILCPENVVNILTMLGYQQIDTKDNDNHEVWTTYEHIGTKQKVILYYCGYTFEIKLIAEE